MPMIEFGRRRLVFLIAALSSLYLFHELFTFKGHDRWPIVPAKTTDDSVKYTPNVEDFDLGEPGDFGLPGPGSASEQYNNPAVDLHPITALMRQADARWRAYESSRSTSFKQVVEQYRSKYGRHPPPGFKEWYKFAKSKNVWNIDDFDQIMDDLRPFWAMEPKVLRTHVAHMHEDFDHGVATLHIRGQKIVKVHNEMWRSEVMASCIDKFIKHLPDMDIPMNRLDQPRVIVPWEDMQDLLAQESDSRTMPPETFDGFTVKQADMWDETLTEGDVDDRARLDAGWFNHAGRQFMKIASKACPPDSPARHPETSIAQADMLYKTAAGGLVKNFNLSSDLCTVGPAIQDLHGMLHSASSMVASHKLVPVFGECKTSVNSDILFPANMYYKHDKSFDYSDVEDVAWRDKDNMIIWRGVTSGGAQNEENWSRMHRQRLVRLLNSTYLAQTDTRLDILAVDAQADGRNITYSEQAGFTPATFADEYSDVGFVSPMSCVPNCDFYNEIFSWLPEINMTSHFNHKWLIDVDGHSFSGRWHAFLQSKSLGFKATIFREWHDSRIFAWRHFVPVDNRYDDLYNLLVYFNGVGNRGGHNGDPDQLLFVPSHDVEAKKLARQGREWSNKVLRRDDIEVYMFRLLLEYGRIIDDNRERIGYSGDGTELDKFDADESSWRNRFGLDKIWNIIKGKKPITSDGATDRHDGDGQGDRWGFGKAPKLAIPPPAVGSDG